MLMEEGRIALGDPVANYIPGFANLKLGTGEAPARAMTVLDLLRHTAGFTYGFHNRTPIDAAYRAQKIAEMDTEGGLLAMIGQLEKLPLEYSPGDAWIYSVATDVVGRLVEVVSGQSYADFVRQRILAPLKMSDTDFLVPETKRDRFIPCYVLKEDRLDLFDDSQGSKFLAPPALAKVAAHHIVECQRLRKPDDVHRQPRGELLGQPYIERTQAAVGLHAQEIGPDDRDDATFLDVVQQIVPGILIEGLRDVCGGRNGRHDVEPNVESRFARRVRHPTARSMPQVPAVAVALRKSAAPR
jgi:CubicO group peptidase (beta-lactamase class C family)